MANYVKSTDFGAKDALISGDANKIIKGVEINDEFDAIQTAVNSKVNANNAALTGIPTAPTAASDTDTTQLATTAFVKSLTGTLGAQDADAVAITGGTITGLSAPLPTASGGTGIATVGTSGQVLSSDGTDLTWIDGGVNSLNGQIGTVVTTDLGAIGSCAMLIYAINGTNTLNTIVHVSADVTISGASLRADVSNSDFSNYYSQGASYVRGTTTTSVYNGGGTALTGTWRVMQKSISFINYNVDGTNFNAVWPQILMTRVS